MRQHAKTNNESMLKYNILGILDVRLILHEPITSWASIFLWILCATAVRLTFVNHIRGFIWCCCCSEASFNVLFFSIFLPMLFLQCLQQILIDRVTNINTKRPTRTTTKKSIRKSSQKIINMRVGYDNQRRIAKYYYK